jgi:hypothetical protein
MTEAQQAELRQDVRLKYGTLITDEGTWELMEFAYMSGMNRAARCNDTAPVAPIGDEPWASRKEAVEAWENRQIADGRNVTCKEVACFEDGWEACRLAAVAAQGAK